MQMELFDNNEIMDEEELKRKEAKEYTAEMIYRSSGERIQIATHLQNDDFQNAFKAFDHGFRPLGFSNDNYIFLSPVSPKGTIKNDELNLEVTSKELFQTLLDLKGYESL